MSRCWSLPFKQSTRSLPSLCRELPGYEALEAGDLLNTDNGHAMLFDRFAGDERRKVRVYEAVDPCVKVSEYSFEDLEKRGFAPFWYLPFDADWPGIRCEFGEPSIVVEKGTSAEWKAAPDREPEPTELGYPEQGWIRYWPESSETEDHSFSIAVIEMEDGGLLLQVREEGQRRAPRLHPRGRSGHALAQVVYLALRTHRELRTIECARSEAQAGTLTLGAHSFEADRIQAELTGIYAAPTARIRVRIEMIAWRSAGAPGLGLLRAELKITYQTDEPVTIEESYGLAAGGLLEAGTASAVRR